MKKNGRKFSDSSKLINWILESGSTCHMTPRVSGFIPGSLEYRDKYIEKGQVQIKKCDDNGNPFVATLHNVLLALDLCDGLFLIITLMNLGHNCLFRKGFCMVYFGDKKKNVVNIPHIAQRKGVYLVKNKGK